MLIKNKLFQYKGGGYDGCYWEWNFFLFDDKGNFHNLHSSGRKGIQNRNEAEKLLSKDKYLTDIYVYRLNREADKNELQKENAPDNIKALIETVNSIMPDTLFFQCDVCEEKIYDPDMYHDGYHGNGGTGIVHTGQICLDCYNDNSCLNCGDLFDDDSDFYMHYDLRKIKSDLQPTNAELVSLNTFDESIGPLCHTCAENHVNKLRPPKKGA